MCAYVLEPGRKIPILPEFIHEVPMVTIQKLATALYYAGRMAIRAQTGTPEKAKSILAGIVMTAEEALEDGRLCVPVVE